MVTLEGPVTVAYKRVGSQWHCIVLEFDLVGVGKSRSAAFAELQGVIKAYLEEVIHAKGKVQFFNPADRSDWNCPRRERYQVKVGLTQPADADDVPRTLSIDQARRNRGRIRSIHFVPQAA
jgi:hypothetical protein